MYVDRTKHSSYDVFWRMMFINAEDTSVASIASISGHLAPSHTHNCAYILTLLPPMIESRSPSVSPIPPRRACSPRRERPARSGAERNGTAVAPTTWLALPGVHQELSRGSGGIVVVSRRRRQEKKRGVRELVGLLQSPNERAERGRRGLSESTVLTRPQAAIDRILRGSDPATRRASSRSILPRSRVLRE